MEIACIAWKVKYLLYILAEWTWIWRRLEETCENSFGYLVFFGAYASCFSYPLRKLWRIWMMSSSPLVVNVVILLVASCHWTRYPCERALNRRWCFVSLQVVNFRNLNFSIFSTPHSTRQRQQTCSQFTKHNSANNNNIDDSRQL